MAKKRDAPALVPVEEQPYPIPENWRWVRLADAYEINPHNIADDMTKSAFVPMEKISAGMKGTYSYTVQSWKQAKKGHTQFADGDVAFAKISPCFENGKSMIIKGLPNGIGAGTTELIVLRQPKINQKYTFFLVSDYRFLSEGKKTFAGTVGQQRISMDYVKNYPVPLPPLPEQQRIVDRIEGLFAKLDAARDKAQAVVDGYALRRAAILHRAFTGELTANWRAEHGISDDSRQNVTIASVCHSLKYGTAKKSSPTGEIVVLRMGNLQGGEIDWSNLVYSNDPEDNIKYRLSAGDVLFNRTNSAELVGKTSIYRGEYPAIYAGYLIKLDYDHERVNGEYLNYQMNSPVAYDYCRRVKTDGVNQSNINARRIGAFTIPLPSMEEQKEITRILDNLLAKEQRTKSAAETVLDTIDTMKKAILGRAFRGELGTNRPEEPCERPEA